MALITFVGTGLGINHALQAQRIEGCSVARIASDLQSHDWRADLRRSLQGGDRGFIFPKWLARNQADLYSIANNINNGYCKMVHI